MGKPLTPLEHSSSASITQQDALANPRHLITLANGLKARVVTAGTAPGVLDQIALWPDDSHPQLLIECNEAGTADPGLVRIDVVTGAWATIVTGATSCDPVRRTPWGTILFGEEAEVLLGRSDVRAHRPLHTTGVTLDRTTGTSSGGVGAENLVARYSLGRLSFEGLAIYPSGLTYYGDENRPSVGTAGGAGSPLRSRDLCPLRRSVWADVVGEDRDSGGQPSRSVRDHPD